MRELINHYGMTQTLKEMMALLRETSEPGRPSRQAEFKGTGGRDEDLKVMNLEAVEV